MLTIAQISDIHLCDGEDTPRKLRAEHRLRSALRSIHRLRPRPVGIIASGDLSEAGSSASYADFWRIVGEETDLAVYPAFGNHDVRDAFFAAAPHQAFRRDAGFLQYEVELGEGLRLIVSDTLEEGAHGAGFCEVRAAWLAKTLDAAPDQPSLVVLHHPPLISGVRWMDPDMPSPWTERLKAVIQHRKSILAIASGHLHRPFVGQFAGVLCVVAPATDIQLTLDLTQIDRNKPDGREILVEEPPGFALHLWEGGALVTHFCVAGDYPSAVSFTFPLSAP